MSQGSEKFVLPGILRQPMGETAHRELKKAIVQGTLPPGTRLREEALASQLGISRTSVREALAKLEQEGLVTVSPFKGTWVSELDRRDVSEIYTGRALIEPWAAGIVTRRCDPVVLERLDAVIERMRDALAKEDVYELTDSDYDFHLEIVAATGNRRLLDIARQLLDYIWRTTPAVYDQVGVPERLVEEHSRIVDVIRSGDAARAEETVRAHLERAAEVTLSVLGTTASDTVRPPRTARDPNASEQGAGE